MVEFVLQQLTAEDIDRHLEDLMHLLQNAVENGASVSFVSLPSDATAIEYWQKVAQEVLDQNRYVVGALVDGCVIGCVHLSLATVPNGLHRAEIQKMLVHTAFRRRGIAKQLMQNMQDIAKSLGRTLLVLDTEKGNPAADLYEQLGWQRVGTIPRFALLGDELIDTVVFYKEL